MIKRTWKVQALAADAAAAVATSPSIAAAARRAGVDRSTLYRWAKSNKIPALTPRRRRAILAPSLSADRTVPAVPEGWAAAIRASYMLDATETELVSLAEAALLLARDPLLKPAERLAAMGRFQALTRQIALEVPHDGEAQAKTPGRWPRRVS